MKALVYTANEEMTYRDEPQPQADPGDALVAIESVGICGSDMHAYLGHDERRVPPLILGHADILCLFPHVFSHATTRFRDQNPYNANKTTF